MKKFENPAIEIEKIEVADVITASVCASEVANCDYDMGMG